MTMTNQELENQVNAQWKKLDEISESQSTMNIQVAVIMERLNTVKSAIYWFFGIFGSINSFALIFLGKSFLESLKK